MQFIAYRFAGGGSILVLVVIRSAWHTCTAVALSLQRLIHPAGAGDGHRGSLGAVVARRTYVPSVSLYAHRVALGRRAETHVSFGAYIAL